MSDEQKSTSELAALMAVAMDQVGLVAEAMAGYRKRLIDGGVGPEAADEMTKDMHAVMMEQIRATAPRTGPPPRGRR